jgi:hypothetical protein
MQLIIFFVEVILIFAYLEYDNLDNFLNNTPTHGYSTEDIIGHSILKFPLEMKENEKLLIIKNSELLEEIITHSPNVEIMSEIFENGIDDKSEFKEVFTAYMKCRHWQYIGGEISRHKFQEFIKNPQNLNSCQ